MFYTYHLYHKSTNKHYYGARYAKNAHVNDLWHTYFTSSKRIHRLIEEYGVDSFIPSIRQTFKSAKATVLWESKFLQKVDAKNNENWLNQHNGDGKFLTTECTEYRAKRISEAKKGKVPNRSNYNHSEETCKKISDSNMGRPAPSWSIESRKKLGKSVKARYDAMSKEEKYELAKRSFSSPESWTAERCAKISKSTTGTKKTKTPKLLAAEAARKGRTIPPGTGGRKHKNRTWKLEDGKRVWMDKENTYD
jgi:hypothetical protein